MSPEPKEPRRVVATSSLGAILGRAFQALTPVARPPPTARHPCQGHAEGPIPNLGRLVTSRPKVTVPILPRSAEAYPMKRAGEAALASASSHLEMALPGVTLLQEVIRSQERLIDPTKEERQVKPLIRSLAGPSSRVAEPNVDDLDVRLRRLSMGTP